jgi:hypothetical protein
MSVLSEKKKEEKQENKALTLTYTHSPLSDWF